MMQSQVSHTNHGEHGEHLDAKLDEGEYTYIDVDVVPKDIHKHEVLQDRQHEYEHLSHIPHGTRGASSKSDNDKDRQQEPDSARSAGPAADGTLSGSSGCMTPVCWRWAVLVSVLVIVAIVTAILVVIITSNSSPANTPKTNVTVESSGKTVTTLSTTSPTVPPGTGSPATIPYNPRPRSCQDVFQNGETTSGVYSIYPDGQKEIRVYCEQTLRGGGWTVFQRRMDGSVDFFRNWADYKAGFGDPSGEYWVGNDNLHTLTANHNTQLLVELQDRNETQYAHYTEFWILEEYQRYELHLAGFTGGSPPGDSMMSHHSGYPFSTNDRDNDSFITGNCALNKNAAWWYYSCQKSNLNGLYNTHNGKGIVWSTWKGFSTSMSAVRMLLKTK